MRHKGESLKFDYNTMHRILKTDIKRNPNSEEDEIIFGCGFSGVENVFETARVVTTSVNTCTENNPTFMKYVWFNCHS